MSRFLELVGVSFAHESAGTLLFEDLTLRLSAGWTGIVGANGVGKTTLLHLMAGDLSPLTGRVRRPGDLVICAQRTDDPPPDLAAFLAAAGGAAIRWRGLLGIEPDWSERWATLSHGERKRAQIGVALHGGPAALAIDEPTNHVDAETRRRLLDQFRTYRGIGLLVSHDRELLDTLCHQCVFLEGGAAVVRPGGYTAASAQAERGLEAARRAHDQARKTRRQLQRAVNERSHEAAQADGKRSKRRVGRKDRDAKARIDAARVSGKDGQAGRLARQLEGRLRQATDRRDAMRVGRERALGMTMRGAPARCDTLWRCEAGTIDLGGARRLELPAVRLDPNDRIGVRGPNGTGKSTLVRQLLEGLGIPDERLVHLPQEIHRDAGAAVLAELHALPSSRRGDVLTAIDCLGSDPTRLLETAAPSPGEVRKLLLALGLAREPHLVVMDEPTNHLDLPSTACLEHALRDCRCALLLVSHDERFLAGLVETWWSFTRDAGDPGGAKLTVTRERP